MSVKHIIPLTPAVYVVRYDENFIKNLNDTTSSKINSCNIVGTVICIYEDNKSYNKLEKYLSEFTVEINHVDDKFVSRYLHSDFPQLPDRLIDVCVKLGSNYGHSKNIAKCMSVCNVSDLFELTDLQLSELFGVNFSSKDDDIKIGIASRNFKYCLSIVDTYSDVLDKFLYLILSTLVELEKIHYNKYCESSIRKYANIWNLEDIYNMFMQTYRELQNSRSITFNTYNSIIYLLSLLQFSTVPSIEVL